MSLKSLARSGFLAAKEFKRLKSTNYSDHQDEAIRDLASPKKRNKGIWEGINKSIYPVLDVIPRPQVAAAMPKQAKPTGPEVPKKKSKAQGYFSTFLV